MYLSNAQARSARANLKLDQKDVSAASGVSVNQISLFEREKVELTIKTQKKLYDFYSQYLEFLDHDGVRRKSSIEYVALNGNEGLRYLFDDIYKTTKETAEDVVIYNGLPGKLIEHLGKEFYQLHANRMSKLRCKVRALIKHGDTNFIGFGWAEYKWLAESKFREKTDYVYGGKTAFISFNDGVKILIIKQKDIADNQRDKFNDVWDHSAEEIGSDVY